MVRRGSVDYVTVTWVATTLKIHAMTVYRLIRSGRLSAMKVGRQYRIDKTEFDRYLREAHDAARD